LLKTISKGTGGADGKSLREKGGEAYGWEVQEQKLRSK